MNTIPQLLSELFNYDFAACKDADDFTEQFFEKKLTIQDLKRVHDLVHASSATIGGKSIPSAMLAGPKGKEPPVMVLAQLHGNEPAGLAGFLMVLALQEAKMLSGEVLCVIGNPLASEQYFSAFMEAPRARQEIRDAYRCGLGEGGALLPDMNRIPLDFMSRTPDNHHTRRTQELFHAGNHVCGVLDIHSARGNMICITDHKHNAELHNSPIRAVLLGLAEAIGAHSSTAAVAVKTLKTILSPLPNIKYQVGIEAGRHETENAPLYGSMFTQAFLHTIGFSKAEPFMPEKDDHMFECYHVQPKWTYADLIVQGSFLADDKIYMAMECDADEKIPKRADRVIVKKDDGSYMVQTFMQYMVQPAGALAYAIYQYDEMQEIKEGAVAAVAVPSGTRLLSPRTMSGIFFSKCASLYDKDPAVGPWPVAADALAGVKFCYPCDRKTEKLA